MQPTHAVMHSFDRFSKPFDANQQIIYLRLCFRPKIWNWITEIGWKTKTNYRNPRLIFINMFLFCFWKIMQRMELTISNVASLLSWNDVFEFSLSACVFMVHLIAALSPFLFLLLFFSISYLHCVWGDYWNTRGEFLFTWLPFILLHSSSKLRFREGFSNIAWVELKFTLELLNFSLLWLFNLALSSKVFEVT